MSSISIIGVGNIARTIGVRAVAGGNSVQLIGRDIAKATALAAELGGNATAAKVGEVPAGDIVILAVPYASVVEMVGQYGDALGGKVLVDITNPFDRTTMTDLAAPRDSSAAQQIAAAAPAGAHVVKAFNTLFSNVLAAGKVDGYPLDVFMAGDDAGAKASVASFIESLGLRPLDTGELKMAHWLEGAGLLMVSLVTATKSHAISMKILG